MANLTASEVLIRYILLRAAINIYILYLIIMKSCSFFLSGLSLVLVSCLFISWYLPCGYDNFDDHNPVHPFICFRDKILNFMLIHVIVISLFNINNRNNTISIHQSQNSIQTWNSCSFSDHNDRLDFFFWKVTSSDTRPIGGSKFENRMWRCVTLARGERAGTEPSVESDWIER